MILIYIYLSNDYNYQSLSIVNIERERGMCKLRRGASSGLLGLCFSSYLSSAELLFSHSPALIS